MIDISDEAVEAATRTIAAKLVDSAQKIADNSSTPLTELEFQLEKEIEYHVDDLTCKAHAFAGIET